MSLVKFVAVAALCAPLSYVAAEELKSGPAAGDQIGAFEVVKCAGAESDGVEAGKTLCYRCKYGSSPMVMVFTRNGNGDMAKFVGDLDAAVSKHSDHGLKGFVNLLGAKQGDLEAQAKKLGKSNKSVPVVVPVDFEKGPEGYALNDAAEVTIILAKKGEVVATHACAAGEFNDKAAKEILAQVEKLCH